MNKPLNFRVNVNIGGGNVECYPIRRIIKFLVSIRQDVQPPSSIDEAIQVILAQFVR